MFHVASLAVCVLGSTVCVPPTRHHNRRHKNQGVRMDIADRLDQLLDLPTRSREGWLQALAQDDPGLAVRLRGLLARVAQADEADFLGQPAAFTEDVGDPVSSAHAAGQWIGPWQLVRPLGAGGMAEVWLAERAAGDYERQVALKLTRAGGAAQRFGRERDVMAQLSHPGIARLYDAGVDAGQAWIAMEYVEGRPLLEACTGLSVKARVALLVELADAVQHAHAQLVVHRDIKPGNVLIDSAGRPRLLDFGIARLLDERGAALTRLGASPLTLEFAAPEQLRGEPVGVACDVYALGVLGRVMLTGRSPWAAWRTDAKSLMAAILDDRMGLPSRDAGDPATARALRGDLDAILLRATAVEPAARYASAQALADDLGRYLRGEPVRARPARWAYVAGRWLRRYRLPVGIATAAIAGLLATTGWALRSSSAERLQATRAKAEYEFFRRLLVHDESEMSDLAHADRRVMDVLREAARTLPTSLADAPQARYQLMRDLAPMLDFAGDNAQAVALLETQVSQAEREPGVDRVEAAKPLLVLAQLREERRGDVAGAYALLQRAERAFAGRAEALPEWAGSAQALSAYLGWKSGQLALDAALPRAEAAAALLRRHPETRSLANDALSLLCSLYLDAGRPADALAAAEEGVAFNLRHLGENNWHTAALLEDAARAAARLRRYPQAEALQRRALAIQSRVFPPGTSQLARARGFLAQQLLLGQKQDEALRLVDEALALMNLPKNRGNAQLRAGLQGDLLQARLLTGRLDTPQPLDSLCVAVWEAAPHNVQRLQAQRCAQLALLRARPAEAQRWIAVLQQQLQARLPAAAPAWAWWQLRQGQWLATQQRPAEAAQALRQALALNPDPLLHAEAWLALAEVAPQSVDLAALKGEVARAAAEPASHTAALQACMQEALGLAARAQGEAAAAGAAFDAAQVLREGLLPDSLWRWQLQRHRQG